MRPMKSVPILAQLWRQLVAPDGGRPMSAARSGAEVDRAPAPFIVGAGRSGTTLLRLMLDAHPSLAIPAETHFIPALARACTSGRDPMAAFVSTLLGHARWPEQQRKTRWGDKTPPYQNQMILIQSLLPEAHFIYMIRDGRDVALSIRELWFSPGGIEETARWWVERIQQGRRQAPRLAHYV